MIPLLQMKAAPESRRELGQRKVGKGYAQASCQASVGAFISAPLH